MMAKEIRAKLLKRMSMGIDGKDKNRYYFMQSNNTRPT